MGNQHADLCVIVANLAGVKLEEEYTNLEEFRGSNPVAKQMQATLPALLLENGELIFTSYAIAKYLASFKPSLLGSTPFEEAQVE